MLILVPLLFAFGFTLPPQKMRIQVPAIQDEILKPDSPQLTISLNVLRVFKDFADREATKEHPNLSELFDELLKLGTESPLERTATFEDRFGTPRIRMSKNAWSGPGPLRFVHFFVLGSSYRLKVTVTETQDERSHQWRTTGERFVPTSATLIPNDVICDNQNVYWALFDNMPIETFRELLKK